MPCNLQHPCARETRNYPCPSNPASAGVEFPPRHCDSLRFLNSISGDVMTIKVGDRLPAGALSEYIEVETEGCTLGPNKFQVEDLTKGKKVVIFGLPGAFT